MTKKPLLLATLGYPGSGKTYFSERFAKERNFFHLNSDKVRLEMFANPTYKVEEHKAVFHFIHWLIGELLKKGVSIVIDANSNKREHRTHFARIAKKAGADFMLVYINTPIEVAERRLIKRREVKNAEKKKYYRPIDISVLHAFKNEIEYPTKNEKHIEINGLDSYAKQVRDFKKKFK